MAEALDNKCPACGAKIKFNPKNQMWDCEYCGEKFTLEQMKEKQTAANEKSNTKDKIKAEKTKQKIEKGMDVYRCKNCGAELIAAENTTATFCVYCGSVAILKEKIDMDAPKRIIPFKKEKESAIQAFKDLKKGRPLMPKIFNDPKNIEKITGVYIPFWFYDLNVKGTIDFNSTDIRTWSDSNYHYTETTTFLTTESADIEYNGVITDGSTHFDDDLMDSLEPFNYKDLEEYNHAYLSGFFAEKYDVTSDEAIKRATTRVINTTTNKAQVNVRHQTKIPISNTLKTTKLNDEYIMLPVWMVNINYKNKKYTFAMNGQTGKMVGDIPIDIPKAIIISIILFISIFVIIMLILGGF